MEANSEKLNTPCKSIVICGAYGAGNMGDEAVLSALISEFRSIDPHIEICVVTRNPKATAALFGVSTVHTFDFFGIERAFEKADIYVNGGGSLIQDVTSRRSLLYYLATIRRAKKHGCTVLMYGCGIGPLNNKKDIKLTASVINECVSAITLRDPQSIELLGSIGVTKPEIVLAADPVLSLEPLPAHEVDKFLIENGIDPDGKYISFSLRPWQGFSERQEAVIKAVKYVSKFMGYTPMFLPMNRSIDSASAEQIASLSGADCVILPAIDNARLALGISAKAELVVSMRLHAVLFAASQGIPSVGISYDPKVSSFIEYTGCGTCIELDELTEDALIQAIKTELASSSSAEKSKRIEQIREMEIKNIQTASRYMGADKEA